MCPQDDLPHLAQKAILWFFEPYLYSLYASLYLPVVISTWITNCLVTSLIPFIPKVLLSSSLPSRQRNESA